MDDILKRLGNVETHVSELRSQVSAILAVIPHLATKADVADVRTAVADLKVDLSASAGFAKADLAAAAGLMKTDLAVAVGAMKADLAAAVGLLKAGQAAAETAMIKWIIATVLASTTLAFTIAKFVH